MRFLERNAVWFVLFLYLFTASAVCAVDAPGDSEYLLPFLHAWGLTASARFVYGFGVRHLAWLAVWGPLFCRWFAHVVLSCIAASFLLFQFAFCNCLGSLLGAALVVCVIGIFTYIAGMVRADVRLLRKVKRFL